MPLGINSILQVPTSTIPKEGNTTSHVHLTFYSDINSVVGAYHYLVPIGMGDKATLSLVKPSLLSIKRDALPPTKGAPFSPFK